MENAYPAGVKSAGFLSEITSVLVPPITVVTAAKIFTIMTAIYNIKL